MWWAVIHTCVWSTGACIAVLISWEHTSELCSKMESKGEGRIDSQQQKKRQKKHRREIPSLWPRGNLDWSSPPKNLGTGRVNNCGASNFERNSALSSYLLTALSIFPYVSHVKYTSWFWVWVCLLTFWNFSGFSVVTVLAIHLQRHLLEATTCHCINREIMVFS